MLNPRHSGAGLVVVTGVTAVYLLAGSPAGETTAVETNTVPLATQTQLAPSTSSASASVAGVFAGQQFKAPALPVSSSDEQFRQNYAVVQALLEAEGTISSQCHLSRYGDGIECIKKIIEAAAYKRLAKNVAIIQEEIDDLEPQLDRIGGIITEIHELVASAKTK